MSQNSTIEWTDATWNPARGRTEISPGCKHCYAKVFAERYCIEAVNSWSDRTGLNNELKPGY